MDSSLTLHTISDALAQARQYPEITSLEAQLLLGHIVGRERTWLIAHPEAPLDPSKAAQYHDLLVRLASGEPLAYLTGSASFYGLDFVITPDVLVPRPDTEVLVDAILEWATNRSGDLRIVDVGTGSGIIAVSLAVKLPDADVTALDLSDAALEVARTNTERNGVGDRVHCIRSNLLESIVGLFDVITANLPYIAQPELPTLSVARWEPILALDGGADGLNLIRALLAQIPEKIVKNGAVFLEIGYDQGERVADLCKETFPSALVEVRADLAELDRVVIIDTTS
jgi:release factor glutamine methyltransferase